MDPERVFHWSFDLSSPKGTRSQREFMSVIYFLFSSPCQTNLLTGNPVPLFKKFKTYLLLFSDTKHKIVFILTVFCGMFEVVE